MERRHGGPEDRGAADAYYGRPFAPHYFVGGSYTSERISQSYMTPEEIAEYKTGYDEQDNFKDYE
jgi:hypothetical protein